MCVCVCVCDHTEFPIYVCIYIYMYISQINTYTRGAKKCIHTLRDVIYVLLFEVELNYGRNV